MRALTWTNLVTFARTTGNPAATPWTTVARYLNAPKTPHNSVALRQLTFRCPARRGHAPMILTYPALRIHIRAVPSPVRAITGWPLQSPRSAGYTPRGIDKASEGRRGPRIPPMPGMSFGISTALPKQRADRA